MTLTSRIIRLTGTLLAGLAALTTLSPALGRRLPHTDQIAYVRHQVHTSAIHLLDVERGLSGQLAVAEGRVNTLVWSPDGRWLLFGAASSQHNALYLIPASGGPITRLTDDGSGAIWSPDSGRIAFISGRRPSNSILGC